MSKILLVFSLLINFLFSFSYLEQKENNEVINIVPLSNQNSSCSSVDSVVNITTINNLISVSGFVIYRTTSDIYIATSYQNYDKDYNYEIIFSDYSRYKAIVVGVAKEDGVLLLKVSVSNSYCEVKLSKSEYIDILESVDIIGKHNYQPIKVYTHISAVGVCSNCNEETYKNYYYTLLSLNLEDYLIGAGVFDKSGQLLGMITGKLEKHNNGVKMLDVNKLYAICYNLIYNGKYNKNYIKYNLLNVNSLTNHEKYLYSLDEGLTRGVLVSSLHYLNYIFGGLNQGMVITKVNGISVDNMYMLDNELSKYKDGSYVSLTVRKISGSYKIYRVKL